MSKKGKVFGTSGEIRQLSKVTKLCVDVIDENNQKAKSMLSQLSDSTKDAAYDEAEEIVEEVEKIVLSCKEPLENVCQSLNKYADLLETMEK